MSSKKKCPMCDTELIKCMWKASHYECPHCKFRCDIEDVDMVADLKAQVVRIAEAAIEIDENSIATHQQIADLKAQVAKLTKERDHISHRHEEIQRQCSEHYLDNIDLKVQVAELKRVVSSYVEKHKLSCACNVCVDMYWVAKERGNG